MYHIKGKIDSTNAPEFEKEIMTALPIEIDAADLEYISSAGLRVLLKLTKTVGDVTLYNVSSEVYEILDVTGFTSILNVKKALREVSVEGCELIGEGANGKVYRLTKDEMIKVFRPGTSLDVIEQERESSRKAFLFGVPCAISFDTVRCGDSYGTVYETLNAATLTERIRENPGKLDDYAKRSAALLKKLHQTEIPEGQLPGATHKIYDTLDTVSENFTPEEIKKLRALYDSIPRQSYFIHNDYHVKNIMEADGELMLIDLGDAGAGNPLIDLIHCCMCYRFMGAGAGKHTDDEVSFIGITYGEMKRYWKVFLTEYCGGEKEAEQLDELLEPYALMMYYTVAMAHPRLPKEYHPLYANSVREKVLSRYDEILGCFA
jgi:uncharacterized protein (TIGR02172 family)